MVRVSKSNPEHNSYFLQYPIAFGIRDYTYFLSYEENESIPITNQQPSFNPSTQDLILEQYEENENLNRRWIVVPKEQFTEE
jgi:hypothetical protein